MSWFIHSTHSAWHCPKHEEIQSASIPAAQGPCVPAPAYIIIHLAPAQNPRGPGTGAGQAPVASLSPMEMGAVMTKRHPFPGEQSKAMVPWWAATMRRTMESPRPVPSRLVEKKGS
jgi:hypothetical protein